VLTSAEENHNPHNNPRNRPHNRPMSLAKENAKKRRRKIILWSLAAMLALGGSRFACMRHADKDAWPERAPSVRLELPPEPPLPPDARALFSPEDAAELLEAYPPPSDTLMDAYRRYQAFGYAATNNYPEILNRSAAGPGQHKLFELAHFIGFDPSGGTMPFNEFIGRSSEFFVLLSYEADAGIITRDSQPIPHYSLLWSATSFTKGGGLIGRYAALNNAMLLVRSTIMDPPVFASEADALAAIEQIRGLENEIGSLDDAFRADRISITNTIDKVYSDLSGAGGRIVRLLGGNKEQSLANIDALFSRLIENSALPYSPHAITTNLPAWCAGNGRAPATRDPIGVAVMQSYLRYAGFAHAVGPSLILELRAARLALALEAHKNAAGEYPENFGALLDAGLLSPADLADPFAAAVSSAENGSLRPLLSYARDGDGWRFWSAGLDQQNDGGTTDAFRSPTGKAQKAADIIFLSRERELRTKIQ
jgi:hypothetical protein